MPRVLSRQLCGLRDVRIPDWAGLRGGDYFLRTTLVYLTPHALQSVFGPWGPVRHTGVAVTLQAVQQPPVGCGTRTRACTTKHRLF